MINSAQRTIIFLVFVLWGTAGVSLGQQNVITIETVLRDMVDRDALARWPQPAYRCEQASSYDRRQITPDEPNGWFANHDYKNYIRMEKNQGRREEVIMEHNGPGCIVRMWMPSKKSGNIRIYLDGSIKPVIQANFNELLTGKDFVHEPLSYLAVRGGNLFLPIPYSKSCKITLDKLDFFYCINYLAYETGTKVKTFTMKDFAGAAGTIEQVSEKLLHPKNFEMGRVTSMRKTIKPQGREFVDLQAGPAAVSTLEVKLQADDTQQALRSVVLQMTCDGQQLIWCPVGDFFANTVASRPFENWDMTITKDRAMSCRWVMPYSKSAKITLINYGKAEADVTIKAAIDDWQWDDRSMYFHANWRQQYPVVTLPPSDWNYIEIKGKGRYVGDTLTTMSVRKEWWGEGDEKVYVDGEKYPSHLGTGLEDYYGFAWGLPPYFQGVFQNVSRLLWQEDEKDKSQHIGHTTVTRVETIDSIPFKQSLKFDMEVWTVAREKSEMAWAVTTYWYGGRDASTNLVAMPDEAARPVPWPANILSKKQVIEKNQ